MSDISEQLKKLREDLNEDFKEKINVLDGNLDKQIFDLRKNLNHDITRKLDKVDEKIKKLEQGMDSKIDELAKKMESRQRAMESDVEFLKGRHDFGRFSPYHASGNGYVAREPGPNLDSLQESREDYENINPYY